MRIVELTLNEQQAVRQLRAAAWSVSLRLKNAQSFEELQAIRAELLEGLLSFQLNAHEALLP